MRMLSFVCLKASTEAMSGLPIPRGRRRRGRGSACCRAQAELTAFLDQELVVLYIGTMFCY
jgi:hypothetical protein